MGYSRSCPKHVAAKLLEVRRDLSISQIEMVERLGVDISYKNISKYKLDKNEALMVLLALCRRYRQIVNRRSNKLFEK